MGGDTGEKCLYKPQRRNRKHKYGPWKKVCTYCVMEKAGFVRCTKEDHRPRLQRTCTYPRCGAIEVKATRKDIKEYVAALNNQGMK